jgi:tRNA A-37 threonylcarbamoyl transferase component Bud32
MRRISFDISKPDILTGYICQSYTDASPPINLSGKQIFETGSSVIIKLKSGDILKCLKVRHWTEYHKLLLGKSRAAEEVSSSQLMKDIGLKVPAVKYRGILSNILRKRGFISFYTMEEIPSTFQPGNTVFNSLSDIAKTKLIDKLVNDLTRLKNSQFVYSDLSISNFLVNDTGDYYWIDTQVKKYKDINKFMPLYNKAFLRFQDEKSLTLNDKEKDILKARILIK